ncbi:helix-turn-helix domain-containing protein [Parapedobacter indicus]|uniref:AraC-type DNA-binding protein n=1 Tax=Parapedobacter indicus TaxID=1477437 RepID=A0A1I3IJD6_9SPHI|nr:AraC family transcriptional regulator [Parapedobacter indicus]PPL02188.1 AraC-like DNA-binding protein [Parapedobacter indicus]SFI47903.1 AraC-type DNA-binding protein [Parapedobacter indicus]
MQIHIDTIHPQKQPHPEDYPLYQIFLLPGPMEVAVDFISYHTTSASLLFLSPYQHLEWKTPTIQPVVQILFHGDFYCIEYHKKEVACNGLLFNNIYLRPFVNVSASVYDEIVHLVNNMKRELTTHSSFSTSVLKAYLQLILALSSKAKKQQVDMDLLTDNMEMQEGESFQQLLEEHFATTRSVSFYAGILNLSIDTFSRKIKRQLGKLPSTLIQERVILEAKKLLHLTYLSIKEIALKLHFEDEHYFSRYFKKYVGISPSEFRLQVGISIVAAK